MNQNMIIRSILEGAQSYMSERSMNAICNDCYCSDDVCMECAQRNIMWMLSDPSACPNCNAYKSLKRKRGYGEAEELQCQRCEIDVLRVADSLPWTMDEMIAIRGALYDETADIDTDLMEDDFLVSYEYPPSSGHPVSSDTVALSPKERIVELMQELDDAQEELQRYYEREFRYQKIEAALREWQKIQPFIDFLNTELKPDDTALKLLRQAQERTDTALQAE